MCGCVAAEKAAIGLTFVGLGLHPGMVFGMIYTLEIPF
jgi:enoyl-CoA hydratase/carnithine racemase